MSNNPNNLDNWVVVDKNGEISGESVESFLLSSSEENNVVGNGRVETEGSDSEFSAFSSVNSSDQLNAVDDNQNGYEVLPSQESLLVSNSISQSSEEPEGQNQSDETDSDLIHLSQDEDGFGDDSVAGLDIVPAHFEGYDNFDQTEFNNADFEKSNRLELVNPNFRYAPFNSLPSEEDVIVLPNSKLQRKHISNVHLNVALIILLTIVLGLALGHFIGAGRQWIAQTKKTFTFEKLHVKHPTEQMHEDSIAFWQKKYKDQLVMNKHLKNILSSDMKELDYKEMLKQEQENRQSKLDIISLQLQHLEILKDLQERLLDLQLKESFIGIKDGEDPQMNIDNLSKVTEEGNGKSFFKRSPQNDELIIVSDPGELKSEREHFEKTNENDKAESHKTAFILFQSEQKSTGNVKNKAEKYQENPDVDVPLSLPLLPPPPPEKNINGMNIKKQLPNSNVLNQKEKGTLYPVYHWLDSQGEKPVKTSVVKNLQDRIVQLQQENNELRNEMTHLRLMQQNLHKKRKLCQRRVLKSFKEPSLKQSNCPSLSNLLECNNLFNLSHIKSVIDNIPHINLSKTENLVKKLNFTKNIFSSIPNIMEKWVVDAPFLKLSSILHQTWNEVKNISKNIFIKKELAVKTLSKKVSEKLDHIENTLEKKWAQLNEKISSKFFQSNEKASDHKEINSNKVIKLKKKEKKYWNKIQNHCNKILEKIKRNKMWFYYLEESKRFYNSNDFQNWLKSEKLENDNYKGKDFWRSMRNLIMSPNQKEITWLVCQYVWWHPDNDVINKQDACQRNKIVPRLFNNEEIQNRQSKIPSVSADWIFTRAQARDAFRERLDPKSEWLFERAKGRQYYRLLQNDFQGSSWKIYDWLNKRAEIRRNLRYLEEFN